MPKFNAQAVLNTMYSDPKKQRTYFKQWYADNKQVHRKNVGIRRRKVLLENRQRIIEYLQAHPCVGCSETDILVLQFDHVDPEGKVTEVSTMLRQGLSWATILNEIEKCVVRCANCHVRQTAKQFGNWRLFFIRG